MTGVEIGLLYRRAGPGPVAAEATTLRYDDPTIRWARAMSLVRELHDRTIIPLEDG